MKEGEIRRRGKRGAVSVAVFQGRLRLVWTHRGTRYRLSVGVDDDVRGRASANLLAAQIERDIALDNFDATLTRYKGDMQAATLTAVRLIELWSAMKAQSVDVKTLEIYRALRKRVEEALGAKHKAELTEADCGKVVRHCLTHMSELTLVSRLANLRECWRWGVSQGYVELNPWLEVKVKPKPKQAPKPFSAAEIEKIREGFRTDKHYAYYLPYVEFLFGTGCRTGEAVGLLWRHVADDFGSVWIGEILSKGKRKSEKRGRARTVPLSPYLQGLLIGIGRGQPDDLVFVRPSGLPIREGDFRRRAWVKILEQQGIPYRKPYLTRSSLISHAIDAGMNPVEVSELVGNRVETLHRHYAGLIRKPTLPDILSGDATQKAQRETP